MNLSQIVHEFLEYLEIERNVSPLTIRNYGHYLNRFLDFLVSPPLAVSPGVQVVTVEQIEKRKQLTVSSVTPEAIRQYRLYLSRYVDSHGISLKRVTQNYHLIAIR